MIRTIVLASAVNLSGIAVPAGTYTVGREWGEALLQAGGVEQVAAVAAVKTSTEAAGVNARTTYTADTAGEGGNSIFIDVVDGGALSILVIGKSIQITVNAGVTTVADLVTAVNADVDATALITAAAAGDGTGFPTSAGQPGFLAGGSDATDGHPPVEYVGGVVGWRFTPFTGDSSDA